MRMLNNNITLYQLEQTLVRFDVSHKCVGVKYLLLVCLGFNRGQNGSLFIAQSHRTFFQKHTENLLSDGALDRSGAPLDQEQGWVLRDLD
jgi:hypothetical protein